MVPVLDGDADEVVGPDGVALSHACSRCVATVTCAGHGHDGEGE